MDVKEIDHRFVHHPPANDAVAAAHGAVRAALRGAAYFVEEKCPEGREKALAVTKLEEAMFWANAAIARNQPGAT